MKIKKIIPFWIDASLLKPHPQNVKMHPRAQLEAIAELIQAVGFKDPIAIDKKTNVIYAGTGAWKSAVEVLKMKQVLAIDISFMPEDKKMEFMIKDNLANESEWNIQNTRAILKEILPKISINYQPPTFAILHQELPRINHEDGRHTVGGDPKNDVARDEVSIPDKAPSRAKLGDIFKLGNHYVMCGDSATDESRAKLFSQGKLEKLDVICTDPPYSSGGRQEAHKKGGSIGSKRFDEETQKDQVPKIKMDDLSTRGYISLIKSVLYGMEADVLYMFTDWRMWDWTREASEASGFPVRQMIVWDKKTPGMGIQWRGQHELICFSKRTTLGGPYHRGNVISMGRSGNEHHPTEKPVPLLMYLMENTHGKTVYDPFGGSGSTMMACEQLGLTCYTMELDPRFVDIMIKRWEDYTKKEAEQL